MFSCVQAEVVTIEDQAAQQTPQNNNETEAKKVMRVNAITEIPFGNPEYKNQPIEIYISPTCLHCGEFLTNTLPKFLEKNQNNVYVKVKFLPTYAKDFFVMKLIQKKANSPQNFYDIFVNYIKRVIATIDNTFPTVRQEQKYRGANNDPEMIKYQVIAEEFKFSEDEIIAAIPDMNAAYENAVIAWYAKEIDHIKSIHKKESIDLPLIIHNNKILTNLPN